MKQLALGPERARGFDREAEPAEPPDRYGVAGEVDCKTTLGDIGRRIHRRRAAELYHRILPAIETLTARGGGFAIKVVVPDALHGAVEYLDRVAALTIETATAGADRADAAASVSIVPFPVASEAIFGRRQGASQPEIAELAGRLLGSPNPEAIAVHVPGQAAVVAVIESAKPDQVLDQMYRTLKKSARAQFSGLRPALLAVRITDMTSPQLEELGRDQNHGLAAIAGRLFTGEDRAHLFGVAFLATAGRPVPAARLPGDPEVMQDHGTALMFRRNAHPVAGDPRLTSLFARRSTGQRKSA